MRMLSPLVLALPVAIAACGPALLYEPRAGNCPERPKQCSFELISGRSLRPYEVIGVLDIAAFSARKLPKDPASFRAAIADRVCKAGGDAVIPGVNFDRRYVLATVVKWVDDSTPTPVCPKALKDAGAPKGVGDAGVSQDATTTSVEAGGPGHAQDSDAGQAGGQ
jgi:hypothetical protein